jgi:Cd2+/Zn2+-exporting ATPase
MQKTYRLENLSCTSCAAKFEKNVRELPDINHVNLNFGASKLTVDGNVSIEELEKAGAFDHIRVFPEKEKVEYVPFYKRRQPIETMISLLLLIAGVIVSFQTAENDPLAIALFGGSILVGGYGMFWTGLQNLAKLQFDM